MHYLRGITSAFDDTPDKPISMNSDGVFTYLWEPILGRMKKSFKCFLQLKEKVPEEQIKLEDNVEVEIGKINARIEQLEKKLESLNLFAEKELSSAFNSKNSLLEKVSKIAEGMAKLEERLAGLNSETEVLKETHLMFIEKLQKIDERLQALEDRKDLSKINDEDKVILEKLQELEKKVHLEIIVKLSPKFNTNSMYAINSNWQMGIKLPK